MIRMAAGALAVFFAVCAQAQDLKTYKGIYEKNTEEIRGGFQLKFDGLQQQYQKSLEALKAAAAKQGDFVRTKAAIDEIERFQKAKSLSASPAENEILEIKAFQSSYVQQYKRLETEMTSQLGMLTSKYEQVLDRLQKELVKALKIDEAAAVNQELEKAQAAIKGYAETLATLKGSAMTNASLVAASPTPAMATGKPAGKKDLYMVVDLSRGPKTNKEYPITYLADVPKHGWKDEYKTDKLVLRRVEPGTFMMGSPEDEVGRNVSEMQHEVTLTKAFYIGVFEVTQKQWERVMGDWPSYFNNPKYRDERPVEQVSYNNIRGARDGANWPATNSVDAVSFMGRLRARTGQMFDLPTEAQWEYACRAGTVAALNTGKNLTDKEICPNMAEAGRFKGNCGVAPPSSDTGVGTAKVGSYAPNAWGLFDLHGNVWEWCLDWQGNSSGAVSDPKGVSAGTRRIVCGGNYIDLAKNCRAAARYRCPPESRAVSYGFRAVLSPSQQ